MSTTESDTILDFDLENELEEQQSLSLDLNDHVLEYEEAGQCLSMLGKDESGLRYAYLKLSACNKRLVDITVITQFKHLLFVNLSQNRLLLDNIQCLTQLPFLVMIQVDKNLLESGGLNEMKYLQVLTMNRNFITSPVDIAQPILECLELNFNQIHDIAELDGKKVPQLKTLEARGNLIKTIRPMRNFNELDSLYLAENKIKRILDLRRLVNLRILHLRDNEITRLRGFGSTMLKLEYINLRENCIAKITRFQKLRCLPNLKTLIYLSNPLSNEVQKDSDEVEGEDDDAETKQRLQLLYILPNLKRINKENVTPLELEKLKEYQEARGEYVSDEESPEPDTPVDLIDLSFGGEEEQESVYFPPE